jgi:hypothetical protein
MLALVVACRQLGIASPTGQLDRRAAQLPMAIQMSDALARNAPKPIKLLVWAHSCWKLYLDRWASGWAAIISRIDKRCAS